MNPNEELNEVWDNYYDSIFETYDSYCKYVMEEWEAGHINELEEGNLMIDEQVKYNNGEYSRDVTYRLLTEQEFNEKFKN